MSHHIHGVSPQVPNQFAAAAPTQTAAAQEAAATRRALLRKAADLGGDPGGETADLMGQWGGQKGTSDGAAAEVSSLAGEAVERPYTWNAAGQSVGAAVPSGSVISFYV